MSMGIGLFMGPVISTIVFRWFGYTGTFMFFAAIIAATGLPTAMSIPRRLDSELDERGEEKDI